MENKNAELKKALLFHDLSGFGRCALSVIIPVLSALDMQPVPVPTALLSTHTGGFEGFTYLDLTEESEKIINHYEQLGIDFDVIYTGFLSSAKQIETVGDFVLRERRKNTYIIVDPVMADNGKIYSTYTPEMCEKMKELSKHADLITPNMTEAFILSGTEYKEPPYSEEFLKAIGGELLSLGYKNIVVTGVEYENGSIGAFMIQKTNNFFAEVNHFHSVKHNINYPGSGDLFTSILCGFLRNSADLKKSVRFAVEFTEKIVAYTKQAETPEREGLIFEKFLGELNSNLKEKLNLR